jgi:hypothetical protein
MARFLDPHPVRIGRLQSKITLPTASGNADDKLDLLVNTHHTAVPVEAVRKSRRPYVENTTWENSRSWAAAVSCLSISGFGAPSSDCRCCSRAWRCAIAVTARSHVWVRRWWSAPPLPRSAPRRRFHGRLNGGSCWFWHWPAGIRSSSGCGRGQLSTTTLSSSVGTAAYGQSLQACSSMSPAGACGQRLTGRSTERCR